MIYPVHQTAYEIFEDSFTVQNFNVVSDDSEGDLWWTPRINLAALLCKMKRGSIFVYTQIPILITIYHIRIYQRVIQTLQRFTSEYFSSLDYNPNTTGGLSTTHKRYMIFPTQFIVNNHAHEFWFKNFSDGFPINLSWYTWSSLILAVKHMKCVFFIFNDNYLTLSHSAMIAKSLLAPSWKIMALEPLEIRLVSSANNTGSVFLLTIQRSFI